MELVKLLILAEIQVTPWTCDWLLKWGEGLVGLSSSAMGFDAVS